MTRSRPEDDIESLIGVRPVSWHFETWDSTESDYFVHFAHTPSADRPEGQPLTMEDLKKLDREYNVKEIQSASNTAYESYLRIKTETL